MSQAGFQHSSLENVRFKINVNINFLKTFLRKQNFLKMRLRGNETFAEFPGCLRERFESHLLKYSLYIFVKKFSVLRKNGILSPRNDDFQR